MLADRISRIDEPQTIRMAKLSRELRAQGLDVVDLSLGEPDFPTPSHLIEAAKAAMDEGFTKYPPVAGYPELRQAISAKFKRENGLNFPPEQVMASTGAKQCIANAILSIVNPGDEVVIPAPFWVTYADIVKLAEGKVIQVKSGIEQDFKITPTQLREAITPATRCIIFSSPCNPTGSIYTREELRALADVLASFPAVYVISDEIYEHINFSSQHESIAQFDVLHNRVIVINGLSKSFAMTGWRLGYMGGPKEIINACEKIQSQFTSGANSITQRTAIAALNGTLQPTLDMQAAFRQRRDFLVEALRQIPGLVVNHPAGAFYVFPDVSHFLSHPETPDTEQLCLYLLHKGLVSCVPGDAFGDASCIRISYATSMDKLEEAVRRLTKAFAQLDQSRP